MLGSLLTFFLVGLVTMIVAGVVLSVVGMVLGMALGLTSFLLFKAAPFLLVCWFVVKVIEKTKGGAKLSDADRKWLDS
jgi:hypothetical protein